MKYIGDFEQLKDYGFTQSVIKDLIIKSASQGKAQVIVNKRTMDIYSINYFKYEQSKVNHNPIRFKVVKQLIQDGLVIEE